MKPQRTVRMPLRKPARRPKPQPLRARSASAAETEADFDEEDYGGETEPSMSFTNALLVVLALHVIAVGGVFAFNSIKARQSADARKTKDPAPQVASKSAPSAAPAKADIQPASHQSAAKAAPAGKTHTVAAGETLSKIASKYGTTVEALEKANDITTLSIIRVGQLLAIPSGKSEAAETAKAAERPPAQPRPKQIISSVTKSPSKPPAVQARPEDFIAASKSPPLPEEASSSTTSDAKSTAKSPPVPAAPKPAVVDAAPDGKSTAAEGSYTVEKGDNPYSIAKRLGVSYKKLLEINQITDPTKIQIGQVLKLPEPGH